jgi:hypothetical protein
MNTHFDLQTQALFPHACTLSRRTGDRDLGTSRRRTVAAVIGRSFAAVAAAFVAGFVLLAVMGRRRARMRTRSRARR